ncbi:MAG TPA: AIR synthase [Firmicutes bacterium]|nr:AIR synthase family protein [Bacillota bacterium]HHT43215.1 AIR synthase [Bacillota bacterium]
MKAGKLSGELLERMVLSTIQFHRDDVLVHAGLGEDCAVIDFGEEVCLITSDPITGAVEGIGELAVHVACNDLAANGGTPVGVQVVLLVPEGTNEGFIHQVMEDIQRTAAALQVEVMGGHTEVTSRVRDCVVSVTAVGRAPKERYVTSGGAKPGDDILITKGVGIEATAILARDFSHLLPFVISEEQIGDFTKRLSVVPEGLLAAEFGVHAMHDITEGGLMGAAREVCAAAGVGAEIWEKDVFVPSLTAQICDCLKLDPLALLSSGSMLIVSPQGAELQDKLEQAGIPAFVVGRITEGDHPVLIRNSGEHVHITAHVEDELWRFFARAEEGN